MVCAFANSPLSSSLVLYHSAAEDLLLPFSAVSSLWEPTFLKGGRRGEEERGGVGEKRKGKGRGGGVVAEKKERNLCPTPIASAPTSFYSPPPTSTNFPHSGFHRGSWVVFSYSWRFPPPVFSRCFLFLPPFPLCVCRPFTPILDLLRGKKGEGEPPNSPPFPSSFLFFFSKWPQEGTYI